MSEMRLVEIVLYKHGLAYYKRRGTVDGTQAVLTFRRGDMDAVLKSLTVIQHGSSTIKSISFVSANPLAGANETTIDLGDGSQALQALISDVRGQTVSISYHQDDKPRSIVGRIVGLDVSATDGNKLVIFGIDGQVRVLRLADVSAFRITGDPINQEFTGALDRMMSRDTQREFVIELNDGQHDLEISYTLPAPQWRVTYRVVAESNADGQSGELQLQGWAVVDNTLNEAWNGVQLKLVTGKPLEASAQLFDVPMPASPPRAITMKKSDRQRQPMSVMAMSAPMEAEADSAYGAAQQAFQPQTEGQDMGELFEFAVQEPITLQRGGAALVPLLAASMSYQRELLLDTRLYQSKAHPVAAIRFVNLSGYTLEAGPVVLIENGIYKGEATLAYSKANTDIAVAYAEEKGIAVARHNQTRLEWGSVQLARRDQLQDVYSVALAIQQRYTISVMVLTIDNNTDQERTLTIETSPQAPQGEYYQMDTPVLSNSDLSRWRVLLPARQTTHWTWQERRLDYQALQVGDLTLEKLEVWKRTNLLDQALYDKLAEIAHTQQAIDALHQRSATIDQQIETFRAQNDEARKTLGVLTSDDADLRRDLVEQLRVSNTRSHTLADEKAELDKKQAMGQRKLQQLVQRLLQQP